MEMKPEYNYGTVNEYRFSISADKVGNDAKAVLFALRECHPRFNYKGLDYISEQQEKGEIVAQTGDLGLDSGDHEHSPAGQQ